MPPQRLAACAAAAPSSSREPGGVDAATATAAHQPQASIRALITPQIARSLLAAAAVAGDADESPAVMNLALARLRLACAPAAVADAAARSLPRVGLAAARMGVAATTAQERQGRNKAVYIRPAACCVKRWGEIVAAAAQAQRDVARLEAEVAAEGARAEAILADLRLRLKSAARDGCVHPCDSISDEEEDESRVSVDYDEW